MKLPKSVTRSAARLRKEAPPWRAEMERIRQEEGIFGDPHVRVAVLDGPVATVHSCFSRARLEHASVYPASGRPDAAAERHGTHVASILFCDDLAVGIVPQCTGIIVPIFGQAGDHSATGGSGLPACTQSDLAAAIRLALRRRADIINVSAGQLVASGAASWELEDAIGECAKRGVLVVAAAGNDGCDCVHVPASLPSVLAVGAMARSGQALATSNYGRSYASHGILAPGEDIFGALPNGSFEARTGTSFAAAVVSGVAALLLSVARARGRATTPGAVGAALYESAAPCARDSTNDPADCRLGRLDITQANAQLNKEKSRMSTTTDLETESTAHQGPRGVPFRAGEAEGPAASSSAATASYELAETASPKLSMALAEATSRRFEAGARVVPAGCDCAGGPTRIVFTFGELGYDFATDTRRDVVTSLLPTGESPYNRSHLLALLDQKPNVTPLVTWLLRANETPLYALAPEGPYAAETYRTLLRALADSSVELVSIAGVVAGRVQLSSGAWVDQVVPVPFALYSWSTSALLETATRQNAALHDDDRRALQEVLKDFLTRIYYEKRNRGESPQERALNYAVTNVFQFVSVFAATSKRMLRLDSVQVNKSPVCREGAECYDVQLIFFNPLKRFEEARHVYQFTVDVSDVVPVTVGGLRTWALS